VAQVFIEGEPIEDFIVAIVVPDVQYLIDYCKNKNIPGTFEQLCKNDVNLNIQTY
jgi:hypothetical protein